VKILAGHIVLQAILCCDQMISHISMEISPFHLKFKPDVIDLRISLFFYHPSKPTRWFQCLLVQDLTGNNALFLSYRA